MDFGRRSNAKECFKRYTAFTTYEDITTTRFFTAMEKRARIYPSHRPAYDKAQTSKDDNLIQQSVVSQLFMIRIRHAECKGLGCKGSACNGAKKTTAIGLLEVLLASIPRSITPELAVETLPTESNKQLALREHSKPPV